MSIDRSLYKPARMLAIYQQYLELQWDDFIHYVKDVSLLINAEKTKLQEGLQKDLDSVTEESTKYEIMEWHSDDIEKYDVTFIKFLFNSSFVAAFSFFENALARTCGYIKAEKDLKLSYTDLSGQSTLERSRSYLSKVCLVPNHILNFNWQEISMYNKVRNCIVHKNSDYRNKNEGVQASIQKFLSKKNSVRLEDHIPGYFYIQDKEFIIEFIHASHGFLKGIINYQLSKPFPAAS